MTHEIATPASSAQQKKRVTLLARFWQWEASGILVALVALMIVLSLPLTGLLYHQSKRTAGR